MDNQFENYYGFEPQKPLTEKKNTEEAAPEDFSGEEALDFEPQKPLAEKAEQAEPSADSGFNPIRHTAVYSDNGFSGAPEPQHQPPQPPQPSVQGYYAQPMPYYPPQPPYPPAAIPQEPAPFSAPSAGKPKANKSLIVVIVVLGVLPAASLFGKMCYTIC